VDTTGYYRRPSYAAWMAKTKTPEGFELHSALSNARVVFLGETNHFIHEKTDFRLWWLRNLAQHHRLVVGEELGFIGVTIALSLFLALFLRGTRVATRANDAFPSLVAFGLVSAWVIHVIVNIGMTLSLMPVTGIPLPFFSYGGSFLLVSWLAVAVLLRVSAEGRGLPDAIGL